MSETSYPEHAFEAIKEIHNREAEMVAELGTCLTMAADALARGNEIGLQKAIAHGVAAYTKHKQAQTREVKA